MDGSGLVDEADLEVVRNAFGSRRGDPAFRVEADIDGDGRVDGADLERLGSRLYTAATYRPPAGAADAASDEGERSTTGGSED